LLLETSFGVEEKVLHGCRLSFLNLPSTFFEPPAHLAVSTLLGLSPLVRPSLFVSAVLPKLIPFSLLAFAP
jgi:hypothetical protein